MSGLLTLAAASFAAFVALLFALIVRGYLIWLRELEGRVVKLEAAAERRDLADWWKAGDDLPELDLSDLGGDQP